MSKNPGDEGRPEVPGREDAPDDFDGLDGLGGGLPKKPGDDGLSSESVAPD